MTGIAAQAALVLALGQTGWESAHATHYRKDLFEQVARNRGMPADGCLVADDRAPLGSFVWVRGGRTGALLHCRVADVSASQDRKRHLLAGLIELRYQDAKRVCGRWFAERWKNCPVQVLR